MNLQREFGLLIPRSRLRRNTPSWRQTRRSIRRNDARHEGYCRISRCMTHTQNCSIQRGFSGLVPSMYASGSLADVVARSPHMWPALSSVALAWHPAGGPTTRRAMAPEAAPASPRRTREPASPRGVRPVRGMADAGRVAPPKKRAAAAVESASQSHPAGAAGVPAVPAARHRAHLAAECRVPSAHRARAVFPSHTEAPRSLYTPRSL